MSISEDLDQPTRRRFCALACQAASVVAAGTLISACSGPTSPGNAPQLSSLNGSVTGRVVSVTIPTTGTLASAGTAAFINTSLGGFLAARTSDTAFTVLTSNCTHADCTVSGFESSHYVCPCHGSTFTTAGAVVNGPAPAPLRSFPSTFANGTLTFTA